MNLAKTGGGRRLLLDEATGFRQWTIWVLGALSAETEAQFRITVSTTNGDHPTPIRSIL